ncbi:OpcA/G6PD domain-containing protein [Litorihabitans aurantiacus]|uniref:OpcA/G6PD domain-containing protein n=1 Tax=Litorihabitans aurantiacus TaxID=1930061 RepID=UPI0032AEBA7D
MDRLTQLAQGYHPGDTDLAWARATLWRGLIAAALDEPPYTPVTGVTLRGNTRHPSLVLLGAWLRESLGVPVAMEHDDAPAITGAVLHRENGDVLMERPVDSTILRISEPSGVSHRVSPRCARCRTASSRTCDASTPTTSTARS